MENYATLIKKLVRLTADAEPIGDNVTTDIKFPIGELRWTACQVIIGMIYFNYMQLNFGE